MPRYLLIAFVLLAGCTVDSSMKPSERTLNDAETFLKPQMSPDEFQNFLKTSPVLVRPNRMRWALKDGTVWTDLHTGDDGKTVIVNAVAQSSH